MRDDTAVLAIVTAMALSFIIGYSFSPGVPVALAEKGTPSAPTSPAKSTEGPASEFTIEATEFKFEPATITVTEGDLVRITIKNTGSQVHNFAIDELGVYAVKPGEAAAAAEGYGGGYGGGYGEGYGGGYGGGYGEGYGGGYGEGAAEVAGIPPGGSATVEFVAEKAGEYTFYCPVPGHREKGMEGKLIVEPRAAEEQQPQAEEGAGYGEGYGGGYGGGYGEGYGGGYGAGY